MIIARALAISIQWATLFSIGIYGLCQAFSFRHVWPGVAAGFLLVGPTIFLLITARFAGFKK